MTKTTETKYIKIPVRLLLSALGLIIAGWFTYLQFEHVLIPGFREIFSLEPGQATLEDALRLMWAPLIAYGLVGLDVYLAVKIFKPLLPYKEEGLLYWLILGLVVGLIWGLFMSLVERLIVWLVLGLIGGLVLGLIGGLVGEFRPRTEDTEDEA
jgi:hypothetical protein